MRFTSGISGAVDARSAAAEAVRQVTEQLAGSPCDLACVFASPIYRTEWSALLAQVHSQLGPGRLIGCSGSGIIGQDQELEWVPAISIVAAQLPGVRLFPFVVSPDELELSSPGGFWVDKIGASPDAKPFFVLFADSYTCDAEKLLLELNETYRTRPAIGGLVSGGSEPGEHFLFIGREVHREGAVGVAMTGNLTVETIVSQGCRPIGRPYAVTRAEENVIWQLGGRPAIEVLHRVLAGLNEADRELAQRGSIFTGLVINELRAAFQPGDFLIRNIVGIDPQRGGIAIGDRVEVGQTLQFHIRDARTSREELRRLLARRSAEPDLSRPPAGALLFNCNGRGKLLYGTAHQDVRTIQTVAGKFPLGGFFCNGEIGPVGGTNFLHGYTASLGLFRPLGPVPSRPPRAPLDSGG